MNNIFMLKKRTFYVLLMCLTAFVLLCFMLHAQEPVPKLVDVKWLKDNLSRENMRIVDVRDDVKEYWKGHIPGAVYIDPGALRWPEEGVPAKLVQPEALIQLLGTMGIDENTLVVVYSDKDDYNASYLLWALDVIGHEHSSMLNGGFNKWEKEKGSITQDYPDIRTTRYPMPSELNEEVRATLDEVKEIAGQGDGFLLDVRPLDMYTGQKGPWKRKGHIPGAVHRFLKDDLEKDGTWKKKAELRKQYEKLDVTPDKTIIVSCGSGMMSSKAFFTLKYVLGYPNVRNYDGSFNEWSNLEELPIQSGTSVLPNPEKLLQSKCTACHGINKLYKAEMDKAGWEKTIDRMIKRGAKLNDTERKTVVEFLSVSKKEKGHMQKGGGQ